MLREDFVHRMACIVSYMEFKGHDATRMLQQVHGLCTDTLSDMALALTNYINR